MGFRFEIAGRGNEGSLGIEGVADLGVVGSAEFVGTSRWIKERVEWR